MTNRLKRLNMCVMASAVSIFVCGIAAPMAVGLMPAPWSYVSPIVLMGCAWLSYRLGIWMLGEMRKEANRDDRGSGGDC